MRCLLVANRRVEPVAVDALIAALEARHADVELVEPASITVRLEATTARLLADPPAADGTTILHRNVMDDWALVALGMDAWTAAGARVVNDFRSAMRSRNKFEAAVVLAAAGIPVLDAVAFKTAGPGRAIGAPDRTVVKPACGARGRGVERLHELDAWIDPIETMPPGYRPFWIAQREVPGGECDVRGFVVGGRCVALMRRCATAGEWRANAFLGAHCTPEDPDGPFGALAIRAVAALGLEVASIDMFDTDAGAVVNEVDPWGGFAAISRTTGVDVAGHVADLVLRADTDQQR